MFFLVTFMHAVRLEQALKTRDAFESFTEAALFWEHVAQGVLRLVTLFPASVFIMLGLQAGATTRVQIIILY